MPGDLFKVLIETGLGRALVHPIGELVSAAGKYYQARVFGRPTEDTVENLAVKARAVAAVCAEWNGLAEFERIRELILTAPGMKEDDPAVVYFPTMFELARAALEFAADGDLDALTDVAFIAGDKAITLIIEDDS